MSLHTEPSLLGYNKCNQVIYNRIDTDDSPQVVYTSGKDFCQNIQIIQQIEVPLCRIIIGNNLATNSHIHTNYYIKQNENVYQAQSHALR